MINRSNPTGGNFFAAIKSFDANIVTSGNFVLIARKSQLCFNISLQLSFPEIAPYALLSEESVADLNNRLENPVSAKNFRPNIVIKGCKAHEEVSDE